MLLTLATVTCNLVLFIRSFGMASRALAMGSFNMNVPVAFRFVSGHRILWFEESDD